MVVSGRVSSRGDRNGSLALAWLADPVHLLLSRPVLRLQSQIRKCFPRSVVIDRSIVVLLVFDLSRVVGLGRRLRVDAAVGVLLDSRALEARGLPLRLF